MLCRVSAYWGERLPLPPRVGSSPLRPSGIASRVVSGPISGSGSSGRVLTSAASELMSRAYREGNAALAAEAEGMFRHALYVTQSGDPDHDVAVDNHAHALIDLFEFSGDLSALDEATKLLTDHLRRPLSRDRQARCLSLLGRSRQLEAERSQDTITMNRAVEARRRALNLTDRSAAEYADRLYELGITLVAQFSMTGDPRFLEEAVLVHKGAVRRSDPVGAAYAVRLSGLGRALTRQAGVIGDLEILNDAIEASREALEAAPPGDAHLGRYESYLGVALLRKYEATSSHEALRESIDRLRKAQALTPARHADEVPWLTNLAAALMSLYGRTSQQAVLDEATAAYRLAVRAASGHPVLYAHSLYGLAGALVLKAERAGDLGLFDKVLELLAEVAELTPLSDPRRANRLSGLAAASFQRFREASGDLAPLDRAIEILREALRLTPGGHPDRGQIMSNLGGLLIGRYEQDADAETILEAVTVHREAMAATPRGHSELSQRLSNFVVSLTHQSALTGQDGGLYDALLKLRGELSVMQPGDSGHAQALIALGGAYRQRFVTTRSSGELAEGMAAFKEALDDRTAPAWIRIEAGRDGGHLAAAGGLNGDALAFFAAAVKLTDEATWARPAYGDRERLLGRLTGLPSDAAAMAISEGIPEKAVELLEQGRGVLLTRFLEVQARYRALQDRAPEIAEQLTRLLRAADPSTLLIPADDVSFMPATSPSRSEIAEDLDAVMSQIRARPDLAELLAAPHFPELLEAAASGPVIILNVSVYGCHALILASGGLQVVELPELDADAVGARAREFRDADRASSRDLAAALEWAWHAIVDPVFRALGLEDPIPADGRAPHVWWCPTGDAVFLPLHAAGKYPVGGPPDTALHRAVSSFTPTLRSLIQLRNRQPSALPSAAGPLIVAMPHTPRQPDLPETATEAMGLASRFQESEYLSESTATHAVVTEAMSRHLWAHFACHGSQSLHAPSLGHLALYDAPLTVSQLKALDLDNPEFAYLSACETHRGGTQVPDETITLASAMQFAGYRHVIAALWPISDSIGAIVAQRFYSQVVVSANGDITIDARSAAAALRTALAQLIEESDGIPPGYWAAYIHTGP